jgi:CRP/FNR family transcriptional regulator
MQTRFTKTELPKTLKRYFPDLEGELLEAMAEAGQILELHEGQSVMQAGQQFRYMIFVLEGNIKIVREDEEGAEFFMYSLTSGDSCALSLSCSNKLESSAVKGVTLEDGIALLIPIEFMERWLPKYKSWARFVVSTLRERIEELLVTFDQVAFRNLDERLEFYLKRLQRDSQTNTLSVSHQQIAADLNTSREVVSRLLKKMEQRGKIAMHRNAVEIVAL